MKRILITGKNSYVGINFEKYMSQFSNDYVIDTISLRDDAWKEVDFSIYNTIFHVAGIAHVSSDPKMEDLYYKVNRDLAVEVAQKAKKSGVKQFIFMSSIIIYGDSGNHEKEINSTTLPNPSNFYGESKLQAERRIQILESDAFKVVIVRPPMIYGKNSKGNYPKLSKLAKKVPFFPKVDNKRSMLHIDNLCIFLKIIIEKNYRGTFFPQNKEYVNTSELVEMIRKVNGKKMYLFPVFTPILKSLFHINIIKKVFGNLVYDKDISEYEGIDYQIRSFEESIIRTERDL